MKYLLILICLFFLGCATTYWQHQEKQPEQFNRDKYDCETEAYARSSIRGVPGNPFIVHEEMRRCLQVKHGWEPQG